MSAPLHKLFYDIYRKELYEHKGTAPTYASPRVKPDPEYKSNNVMAKQWNCSARHASKVRRGVKNLTCKDSCGCPRASKST
jgi:hypothetical protein